MGFLDKMKEQAEKAKVQAQDLKVKAQDKVDDVQDKRKVDGLLADLGRLVYAEQTGRQAPEANATSQRIIDELKALEAKGVTILAAASAAPAPAGDLRANAAPEPPPYQAAAPAPPPPLPTS